jgi:hypothetical protein
MRKMAIIWQPSSEFLCASDLEAPQNPTLAFDPRPSTFDIWDEDKRRPIVQLGASLDE